VDNKKPALEIVSPASASVNGTIAPQVTVTDEIGVNSSSIVFRITGSTYNGEHTMACTEHVAGKKYFCSGSFNTTGLADASYTLNFTAADIAGNYNSTFMAISTANGVNTTTATTSTTSTTTTTTTTTTTLPGQTTTTTIPGASTTTTIAPFWDIDKSSGNVLPIILAAIAIPLIAAGVIVLRRNVKRNPWEVPE
jgi:hypothetical protein